MIYLDTTDSCQSPMNTGVQRVVRGIFRGLNEAGAPVTPLLWEPAIESFCTLAPRELGFLAKPFAGAQGRKARARPQRAALALPVWSKLWRRTIHRRNRLDLGARLTAGDVVFTPEIFKDSRREWFKSHTLARRVAVFHDAIPWRLPEMTSPSSRHGFVDYLQALSEFDAIIAVSQASADDLRAAWKSQGVGVGRMPPINVLGWPMDELFGEIKQTLPARKPHPASPKILCVGTFEPRKNHLNLLAAAEQLWQGGLIFELELIGRTTAQFGARVLAEVRRLRVAGRPVAWRRHVDDATLLAAYDDCAFTVFPSVMEGFGLPIMESLLRGRPCICGANGALGEIAGDGCLTVDQTDAKSLAAAMKRLLTDAELNGRLSAEARARKFLTWRDYVAKLLPLLNSMGSAK